MIKDSLVFVLGAGASIPYSFPSGVELRREICAAIADNNWIVTTLRDQLSIPPNEVKDFARAFLRSNITSIDSFLTKRPEFTDLGKLAIAASLCVRESPQLMENETNEDHWYRALWNALIEGCSSARDIGGNPVKFVSFNYDRSLEYFLYQAAKNTFGVDDKTAFEAIAKLQIVHVYGELGKFSLLPSAGARQYAPDATTDSLRAAANGIRVIPEARGGDKVFQHVRDMFAAAKQICFLGYGFDPLNNMRLGLDSVLNVLRKRGPVPRIVASVFEKTNAERAKAQAELCPSDAWEHFPYKNLLTLRESGVLFR